jgi:hypothetical protein
VAASYGSNRSEHGNDLEVVEARANLKNGLDMTSWGRQIPEEIRKAALAAISEWEGRRIRKPRQEDIYWFVDQPEIVDMIKKMGYDHVIFGESSASHRSLGVDPKTAGPTYAVFYPELLHIPKPPMNIGNLFDYLKNK